MKRLLVSLFIAALTSVCRATSTDTVNFITYAPVIETPVEQKVVEIHMTSAPKNTPEPDKRRRNKQKLPYEGHATCSGSFIDSMGDILTARHCVEGFESLEVQTFDHRHYAAIVIATSAVHDLALIHIDRRNTAYFSPASNVARGETIFVLGSPLGITDTLSTGIIARIDGDTILVDCSALPGNSGGPVFDQDEKLVGVLNAGFIVLYGTTHLNVAQGLDAVSFFIIEALEKLNGRR